MELSKKIKFERFHFTRLDGVKHSAIENRNAVYTRNLQEDHWILLRTYNKSRIYDNRQTPLSRPMYICMHRYN